LNQISLAYVFQPVFNQRTILGINFNPNGMEDPKKYNRFCG